MWTVTCRPTEAQFFIFSLPAHSLGDLILNYGSNYQKVLTTRKCMSPAQTSPLNSRLIYPTAYLTSRLGNLINITDFHVPNASPDRLIHACTPSASQKMTIPFFQLLCPLFFLSPPLTEQEILLTIVFKKICELTTSHHLNCNSPGLSPHHQLPRGLQCSLTDLPDFAFDIYSPSSSQQPESVMSNLQQRLPLSLRGKARPSQGPEGLTGLPPTPYLFHMIL